ncbi:hypothetical protein M9434_005128 [Picochlorum sp. BPE23]|nr:hypothetical protein M9434_005128 [Picochlorum sp. BPE23]
MNGKKKAKEEEMLALQSAEQFEKGWRRGQRLIDSLPYVDDVTEDEKNNIQRMIQEEMRGMGKSASDYLDETPQMPSIRSGDDGAKMLYEQDVERVGRLIEESSRDGTIAVPFSDGVDLERYNLPRPQGDDENSVEAWEVALDNARAQLEHQKTRIVNLQLLLKHGPTSWRAHNEVLSTMAGQIDEKLQILQGDITHINKERKIEQLTVGSELESLKNTYFHLVEKNMQLNAACSELENRIR